MASLTQALGDIRRLLSQQPQSGLLALINQQAASIEQLQQKVNNRLPVIQQGSSPFSSITQSIDASPGITGAFTVPISTTQNLSITGTASSTIGNSLWVKGTLRVGANSIYITDTSISDDGGAFAFNTAATSTFGTLGFTIGTNQFLVQQTSGNIGVGTTSPYARLSVVGPVVSEYFHATSTAGTSTFAGGALFTRAPTIAHTFSPWTIGVANSGFSNAALVINPASAVADSNLLALAVGDSVKLLVDEDGDVFASSLTTEGSVNAGATTISTLTVENTTTLGDAVGDTITANGRFGSDLIPATDNLYSLGTSTSAWLRWKDGLFGTQVGIGGTATSTGANLLAAAAYLIDSAGALSINTTNNQAVTFGTGKVTIPYASTTALTVSGSLIVNNASSTITNLTMVNATSTNATTTTLYASGATTLGSLTGPLQAISGLVSATSTLSAFYGGTGQSAWTKGDLLYANNDNSLAKLNIGTIGITGLLGVGGSVPAWVATSTLGLLTTNVAEGTNQYYTDDKVNAYVHASTTIAKAYSANTFTGANVFNSTFTLGTLTGPLEAVNGLVSASSTLSIAYGGTGGNTAATARSSLSAAALGANSDITSLAGLSTALSVAQGGTGQTSFGQGWLNSNGTSISASTSPTINYFVATSTTATSTIAAGLTVDTNTLVVDFSANKVGIGTSVPRRALDVLDASSPQLRLSQADNSLYADFQVAASTGDLTNSLTTTATKVVINQPGGTTGANLWLCQGDACPTAYITTGVVNLTNGGNIVTENSYFFGNGFRISNVDASTTAVYDTTGTIVLQFDETP